MSLMTDKIRDVEATGAFFSFSFLRKLFIDILWVYICKKKFYVKFRHSNKGIVKRKYFHNHTSAMMSYIYDQRVGGDCFFFFFSFFIIYSW